LLGQKFDSVSPSFEVSTASKTSLFEAGDSMRDELQEDLLEAIMVIDNQNDQAIVRQYGEFSVGAWLIRNSEDSAPIQSPSLNTQREISEPNAETTNILTLHREAGQLARRGPTGPRTELGKKRSSQNALKSGIFSRAALLKGESRSEYQTLLEDLRETCQPEGKVEEILVDKLASIIWRYRRLLLAEGAEIRRSTEFVEFDRKQMEQKEAETISREVQPATNIDLSFGPVGLIWNTQNPVVLERSKELLIELWQRIETDGLDEPRDKPDLETIYGDARRLHLRPTFYDWYTRWFLTAKLPESERQKRGYATPEQCKDATLEAITDEITRLKRYQKRNESIESDRMKLEILRKGVPNFQELDHLLRYETSLERAFDRTLTQLERLQRIRKGQPIPPQVDVKIS
jgi:hypothetical protein